MRENGKSRKMRNTHFRKIEQSNAENGQGEERAIFSAFGNAPVYQLFDGQKTAGFSNGTGEYYQDELLYLLCLYCLIPY